MSYALLLFLSLSLVPCHALQRLRTIPSRLIISCKYFASKVNLRSHRRCVLWGATCCMFTALCFIRRNNYKSDNKSPDKKSPQEGVRGPTPTPSRTPSNPSSPVNDSATFDDRDEGQPVLHDRPLNPSPAVSPKKKPHVHDE